MNWFTKLRLYGKRFSLRTETSAWLFLLLIVGWGTLAELITQAEIISAM